MVASDSSGHGPAGVSLSMAPHAVPAQLGDAAKHATIPTACRSCDVPAQASAAAAAAACSQSAAARAWAPLWRRLAAASPPGSRPPAPHMRLSRRCQVSWLLLSSNAHPFCPGRHTCRPYVCGLRGNWEAGSCGRQGSICCCKLTQPYVLGEVAAYGCPAGHSSVPTQAYNKSQPMPPASKPVPGVQAGSGPSSTPFAAAPTQAHAPARQGSRAGVNGRSDEAAIWRVNTLC